jgi:hypothetical protein
MFRRLAIAVIGAAMLVAAAAAQAQSTTSTPVKESGNPINDQGSSYHYRSYIKQVAPNVPGVSLQVLQFADRLELINRSGQTVTVFGYEGEPYAQVLANGTVRFNTSSPAYYLNQAFYANVTVPPSASPRASPHWVVVAGTGRLEWHDHRIHWMSPVVPPQVKDQSKRTKVFDWQVPIQVGARKGAVAGELFWVPASGSKAPGAAIVALVAIVVFSIVATLTVRRRRRMSMVLAAQAGSGTGEAGRGSEQPTKEAW